MSYGPKQVFTGGIIASGVSTGTFIDLSDKTFTKLAVKFPSMSTAAALTIYGCDTDTGTYLPVHERAATATIQYQAMVVATSTSGAWAVFDAPPFRYIKFVASATVTDGAASFVVIAQD